VNKGEYDKAVEEGERGASLDPNSAVALTMYGSALMHACRYEEAISVFQKALRLSPVKPMSGCLQNLGVSYRQIGKYDEAVKFYKRLLQVQPNHFIAHLGLTATYSMMGRLEDARAQATQVLRIIPKFSLESFAKKMRFKNPADVDRFIDALRKAGLPDKPPLPLPDKPSIAVLPFTNMSGDPKQEYLSDGITESIISAVSKIRNLFVIARTSSFKYKGKKVDVRTVGRELGVQYVLEGSVQRSGDRLRITAQLIHALNGRQIWSERYDRELKDLYAMQDDITMEILEAMRVKLIEGEQVLKVKRPSNIEIALKAYQAWDYCLRFTPEANVMARKLAEEVVAAEPSWGEGYYYLASTHMMEILLGTTKSQKESFARAIEYAEKAISLDDSLSQALGILGFIYGMKREYDKSVAYAEKGVAVDPNGADAHAWLGNCLSIAARPQEAIPYYKKAMRLNPSPPQWYYIQLGQSYRMLGRYEESVAQLKKALALAPNSFMAYIQLLFTYAEMGREDEARAAAEEMMRINPEFSVDRYAKMYFFYKDKEYCKRWVEALRKAGLK